MHAIALYGLFFFSGAAGLAYQIAWTRLFATGLGHETPAMLAVVAALFGGMALGSWFTDSPVGRRLAASPGVSYALLELVIGIWALISIPLIPAANGLALHGTGLDASAARQWAVAFFVPALVLLPATAAMGATFPVMESFLGLVEISVGRRVAGLYAANTFGAALGVVGATFLVLPRTGYSGGLGLCAGLNLICAAIAFRLQRGMRAPAGPEPGSARSTSPSCPLPFVLIGTGLLGIGFEVLGVRVLREVLENTVYTYAAVLTVYLLGTAAGAALGQKLPLFRGFGADGWLLATGVASLIGTGVLTQADRLYALAQSILRGVPGDAVLAEFVTAAGVFLLPTVAMGATLSHLLERARSGRLGLGRGLALNTLGSAAAPLLFGVVLLPVLEARLSFAVLAVGYVLLARPRRWAPVLGVTLLGAVVLLALGPLQFVRLNPRDRVVQYQRGAMESVAVVEQFDGNRTLLVNNRFSMGGTGSALAERRHASLPLLLHPDPKRALFLGLGTGITFAGAGSHPGLRADAVELVPEVVGALPWFQPQNALPSEPGRFRIQVADARRFVRVSPERYDVIVADLFHPDKDGAGALYAVEHYRAIRDRLAPGGLVCQWLPLFQLDEPMLRVITRTFLEVFPETSAFLLRFNVDTPVLGLLSGAPRFRRDYLEGRVRDPKLAEALAAEQLRDTWQLFGCALAGPDQLRDFAARAPLNTDDRPLVLFGAPELRLGRERKPYDLLLRLLDLWPAAPPGVAEDERFAADLSRFIAARNLYLRGRVAETEGRDAEAMESFIASAQLSPWFSTGYAQVLQIAVQKAKSHPAMARELLERLDKAQPNRPVARQLLDRLFPSPKGGE